MTDTSPPPASHPTQRVIRTIIQTTAAVSLGVVACVTTTAVIAPQILEAVRELLPDDVYAWAVAAIAFIATLAGALTRIMAVPGVDAFLMRLSAGSMPKHAERNGAPHPELQREVQDS